MGINVIVHFKIAVPVAFPQRIMLHCTWSAISTPVHRVQRPLSSSSVKHQGSVGIQYCC